jgi:hypothetical protein
MTYICVFSAYSPHIQRLDEFLQSALEAPSGRDPNMPLFAFKKMNFLYKTKNKTKMQWTSCKTLVQLQGLTADPPTTQRYAGRMKIGTQS